MKTGYCYAESCMNVAVSPPMSATVMAGDGSLHADATKHRTGLFILALAMNLSNGNRKEHNMQTLTQLRTAAILKNLKADGLTNRDIIQLVKTDGWPAVSKLAQA